MNLKRLLKPLLLAGLAAAIPAQASLANSVVNTLANYNNGFIHEKSAHSLNLQGVDSINTFQKGNSIILQVSHNPKQAYETLINNTLMQGGRINGINFQSTFTLGMVKQYCDNRIFQDIKAYGFADKIRIDYKDQNGQLIKRHNISESLCRTAS